MNNGNVNNNNKTNTNRVRAVAPATPRTVYDIPFSSVIEAWTECERNKRTSNSCVKFRWHAARDLVELWQQMCAGQYVQRTSMCFIVTEPVRREVWAASFRDRIAHHWEDIRFRPVLERYFVRVGDRSMNCRKGYGALRAVRTFEGFIDDYTEGFTRDDCYIVGGDFANFFMSIDKELLWRHLERIMTEEYEGEDKAALLYMMRTTLFHSGTMNYFRKSPLSMWEGLPKRKSLFHMPGLEIGNLPNQIWANFLGAIFTDWMVCVKGEEDFIIFVDDWRSLVRNKAEGRRLLVEARAYLAEVLHITLHPNKVYLQHYTKGTKMVGAVIKVPDNRRGAVRRLTVLRGIAEQGFGRGVRAKRFGRWLRRGLECDSVYRVQAARTYISNRTRGRFVNAMSRYNVRAAGVGEAERVAMLERLRATVNSYLGMMIHHRSYRVRRRVCAEHVLPTWGRYVYFTDAFGRCVVRSEYDEHRLTRRRLRRHDFAARFLRPRFRGRGVEEQVKR